MFANPGIFGPILRSGAALSLVLLAACAGSPETKGPAPAVPEHVLLSGVHVVDEAPDDCPVCRVFDDNHQSIVRIHTPTGLGAGVVVSNNGRILTNAHVVGDLKRVVVETYFATMVQGRVEAIWPEADLALIAVESPDVAWTPVQRTVAELPRVGTTVYAIGHPAGLGWTVSVGIVSGVRPPSERMSVRLIQTDAAVSPGNSGGALLDHEGHLIGIVSSKLVGQGMENVAFAVSASDAFRLYDSAQAESP